MPRKTVTYKSDLNALPSHKIYINVKNMDKGDYEIIIVNDKKTVLKTTFKKT